MYKRQTLERGSIVNCTDADGDGGAVDVSNTGVTETPVKYGKFVMNGGTIKAVSYTHLDVYKRQVI